MGVTSVSIKARWNKPAFAHLQRAYLVCDATIKNNRNLIDASRQVPRRVI